MSDASKITEVQLWLGLIKMALLLTFLVVILGLATSVLPNRFESIAMNSLFFCLAFFMLSNGKLGVLQIIDWFETRKAKKNG